MAKSLKKRGQKFLDRFSRASIKASEEGKEHLKKNLIKRISHIKNIRLLILEWALLIMALTMLAVAQAFWFSNSYSENFFTKGSVYTEATIGEVNSLNPLFAITNSERVLSRLMFSTITTNDYSGHIGTGLARSITSDNNGKIWRVKLLDNLKWSDGEPITNEDVIFTADLIKNPAVNSIYSSNLRNVKVSENEEGEIVFELPSAYADFMSALNIPIVPKHILESADPKTLVENSFSKTPITSGAFTFNAIQSGSATDERIYYLASNANYYEGKTLLGGFSIHTYPDKARVIDAMNMGAVTATAELSETDSDLVSPQFLKRNSSLNSGAFVFFNTSNGPTKDLALRKAIRQGIDIEKIQNLAEGTAALNYPLLDSQIKLAYPEIPKRDFSAAKSKIDELSSSEKIHLNLATVNSGFLPKVAEELKNELENLGLEAHLTVYEEGQEFISNIISRRNYDVLVYEIELGADPDLLPYYHSSQTSTTGLNLSNYRNALTDDLLLGARDTTDHNLRVKKYESFLSYWISDVPAIGLYQANLTYYYNKKVRTFGNSVRLITPLDRFCDINSWSVTKETKNKTP